VNEGFKRKKERKAKSKETSVVNNGRGRKGFLPERKKTS